MIIILIIIQVNFLLNKTLEKMFFYIPQIILKLFKMIENLGEKINIKVAMLYKKYFLIIH